MEFSPFSPESQKFRLQIPNSQREMEFSYDEKSLAVDDKVKETALGLLQNGYSYILGVIGEDSILGMNNILKFKRSGRHGTGGLDMHINVSDIEDLDKAADKKDLQQSLFIHEIIHHLFDEEHFSMFIEMIYMLEKGHNWRFENMKELYKSGRLAKPYIEGLQTICTWLQHDDIEIMLDSFPNLKPDHLKEIFKRKYQKYCQEDPTLAQEIEIFRGRLKGAA